MTVVLLVLAALLLVIVSITAMAVVRRKRAASSIEEPPVRTNTAESTIRASASEPASSATWRERVNDIVVAALDLPSAERESFVGSECAGDVKMYDEVMSLIAAGERDGVLDELSVRVVQPVFERSMLSAGDEIGRYRIEDVLGHGGMGVVYRAHDTQLDRMVALKFLPAYVSTSNDAKERFLAEARAAAALDHPNVCTIHEVGESRGGYLFIAMPYYGTETLGDRLRSGALAVADAIDIAMQVARGLAKAHERGIVHRDIKPANIVLTEDGVAKILDFGIAKLASSHTTRPGVQPGTAAYMSPEQASGETVDNRTDIWALGIVLHEMLTGTHPFGSGTDAMMVHSILTRRPAAPGEINPDVPPELDRIVQRAIARNTAVRYADVRDMAGDLEECAARLVMANEARARPASLKPAATVPAEGERRNVTVLVSSLAGSIETLDRLSPAEADAMMASLRAAADRIMTAHDGVLNEVTGEELICLFGVPRAHEDDYVRAVRAAKELHAAAAALSPISIQLHSGIDAGVVLARPSDARDRAFRVAGDPLRTAMLLSTQADADTILVSTRCQRLIAPYYLTRALDPIAGLRGETRFVPHVVLGKSGFENRLEAAGPHGLTRYAGRERELGMLHDAMNAALRGQGSVVGVIGDTGVGKSRLIYEFRTSLDRSSIECLMGRCHSRSAQTPYEPFVPVLLRALGIDEELGDTELTAAIASAIQRQLPDLAHLIPLCLQVVGIEDDAWPMPRDLRGDMLRAASGEAIASVLTALSERKPMFIVLEDWHWAHEASREALDPLVVLAASHGILIAVTTRPDVPLDWNWSQQHAILRLDPLDEAATTSIMRSVLGVEGIDGDLAATIHERAGGNPFFVEELCRTLVEQELLRITDGVARLDSDTDELDLPETVQIVIRTRLDRLDDASRTVLRTASVIGREFDRNLLEMLIDDTTTLDASLARLRDAGLIQPVRLLQDPRYRFRHALTQEVAYGSLPDHLSRTLHRKVGESLERRMAERGESHPSLLCTHFAAAEEWMKAVHYAREAAERVGLLSSAEARALLDRALTWLERTPADGDRVQTRIELLLENERYVNAVGDRQEQRRILHDLIDLLEPLGDSIRFVQVYVRIGEMKTLTGDFDSADDALGKALRMARRLRDEFVEADVLTSLAFLRWNQARNEEGRELLERTIEIRRATGDRRALAGDLLNIGTIIGRLGDHAKAIATIEDALAMCRGEDLPFTEVNAMIRLAFIHRDSGDDDRAIELIREANAIARNRGLAWLTGWTGMFIADTYIRAGDVEKCLAEYRAAIETSRRSGIAFLIASALRSYGLTLYGLERYENAIPSLREAEALLDRVEKRDEAAQVARALAFALDAVGDHAAALSQWHRLRSHARRTGDEASEFVALKGIGMAQRRLGTEAATVIASLEEAAVLAGRIGDHSARGNLLNTIGIIEFERSNAAAAKSHFTAARSAFEEISDSASATQMIACIAACEARLGEHDAAIASFKTAIAGHRGHGQSLLEAQALGALGDVYMARADYASAATCFEESLRIRREIGDRAGAGWMLLSLGRASAHRDSAEPRRYWEEAQSIANECGDHELHEALAACVHESG